jgi:outer membrane lipoprotein SlyB
MHRSLALFAALLVVASACTTTQERVQNRVDPGSISDNERYQADVAECVRLADNEQTQTNRDMATRSVVGGLVGAAAGAAIGAAVGGGAGAGTGAAIGGTTGVVGGAVTTQGHRDEVIRNCLQNRGYKTLY